MRDRLSVSFWASLLYLHIVSHRNKHLKQVVRIRDKSNRTLVWARQLWEKPIARDAQIWPVLARGSRMWYLPPIHEPYMPLLDSRRASPPFGWYSLRLPTEGWPGWVDSHLGHWLYTEIGFRHRELNPGPVTHGSTSRVRRRVTTLIETNVLPLNQCDSCMSSMGISVLRLVASDHPSINDVARKLPGIICYTSSFYNYTVNRKTHLNIYCHIIYRTWPFLTKFGTLFREYTRRKVMLLFSTSTE